MRAVARLAAVTAAGEGDDARFALDVEKLIEAWLRRKGAPDLQEGELSFHLIDGRTGRLTNSRFTKAGAQLVTWTLAEATPSGAFETQITLGQAGDAVALLCQLRAGAAAEAISPVPFEVRTPSVVRDVFRMPCEWRFGQQVIATNVGRFAGSAGGEQLAELLTNVERALPVIAVSEQFGFPLHPTLSDRLCHDLVGLATVVSLDDDAGWGLTNAIGQRFSCYGGAVRLYWPGLDPAISQPLSHPLWTVARLMDGVSGTTEAAERICRTLRRRVHGISALTVQPPPLLLQLQDKERAARFAEKQRYLADADDYHRLAEEYFSENRSLHARVEELEGELRDAQTQLRHLRETLMYWQPTSRDDVLPEESPDALPKSVAEAVARAQSRHIDLLVFGDDVADGVQGLHPLAGPPSKVLQHLDALAELTRLRKNGGIGTSPREWFRARNIMVSDESEVLSAQERSRRTWHDGETRRLFVWHTKPSDSVSPDKCVRIYFEWDKDQSVTRIGWVGRHP